MDNSANADGLKIGPFINITLQQISIGVITNLIVFPPSLLLVQLFRRTKRRHTRLAKIKNILNDNESLASNQLAETKKVSLVV